MVGMVLIKEIEDLLLDKLDKQESCLKFYEQVDPSVREDVLLKTFDQIDRLEHDIQSMDLLFLSKFDKFKVLNNVDDINNIQSIVEIGALQETERQSLKLIKKAVALIAQRERALETSKNETQDLRLKMESNVKKTSRETKAYSAYRNINK